MLTRIAQTFRYTTRCNQRSRNLTSFRLLWAKWINSCPVSCLWQIKRLAQTVSFTFNCFWNFSLERRFEAGKGFSRMFLADLVQRWISWKQCPILQCIITMALHWTFCTSATIELAISTAVCNESRAMFEWNKCLTMSAGVHFCPERKVEWEEKPYLRLRMQEISTGNYSPCYQMHQQVGPANFSHSLLGPWWVCVDILN